MDLGNFIRIFFLLICLLECLNCCSSLFWDSGMSIQHFLMVATIYCWWFQFQFISRLSYSALTTNIKRVENLPEWNVKQYNHRGVRGVDQSSIIQWFNWKLEISHFSHSSVDRCVEFWIQLSHSDVSDVSSRCPI